VGNRIDPARWQETLDAFSRQHGGWKVSISVRSDDQTYEIVRNVPLHGVVSEEGSIVVMAGDKAPHFAHFISNPAAMEIETLDDGSEAALLIRDQTGDTTTVAFRSPVPAELVDGAAVL
jgi:hypothetical protein